MIDLSTRTTSNMEDYENFKSSSQSLIYIKGKIDIDDSPASIDLSVGDTWFIVNENKMYQVDDSDGLELNPKTAILIETAEFLKIPYNVFGLVTGKGSQIFKGIFISTGKIDPGYEGKIRIGIYNGSNKKIIFNKNQSLCSCMFFNMDTTIPYSKPREQSKSTNAPKIGRIKKIWRYAQSNTGVIAFLISLLLLFVQIYNAFFKK